MAIPTFDETDGFQCATVGVTFEYHMEDDDWDEEEDGWIEYDYDDVEDFIYNEGFPAHSTIIFRARLDNDCTSETNSYTFDE